MKLSGYGGREDQGVEEEEKQDQNVVYEKKMFRKKKEGKQGMGEGK